MRTLLSVKGYPNLNYRDAIDAKRLKGSAHRTRKNLSKLKLVEHPDQRENFTNDKTRRTRREN